MEPAMRALNSKERKEFHKILEEQFGFVGEIDGIILRNDKREKFFLCARDLDLLDTSGLRVDTKGLYIAAFMKGRIRLTIEGSALIGPHATKHVIALNDAEALAWLAGGNIPLDILEADVSEIPDGTFLIIRHGEDWLGTGRKSDQFLYNYVPKTRQVHASFEREDEISDEEESGL